MGRNEVEDPERSGGLRPAAAGLEGSAAHPAPPGKAKEEVHRAHARWPLEPS